MASMDFQQTETKWEPGWPIGNWGGMKLFLQIISPQSRSRSLPDNDDMGLPPPPARSEASISPLKTRSGTQSTSLGNIHGVMMIGFDPGPYRHRLGSCRGHGCSDGGPRICSMEYCGDVASEEANFHSNGDFLCLH